MTFTTLWNLSVFHVIFLSRQCYKYFTVIIWWLTFLYFTLSIYIEANISVFHLNSVITNISVLHLNYVESDISVFHLDSEVTKICVAHFKLVVHCCIPRLIRRSIECNKQIWKISTLGFHTFYILEQNLIMICKLLRSGVFLF